MRFLNIIIAIFVAVTAYRFWHAYDVQWGTLESTVFIVLCAFCVDLVFQATEDK